MAKNIREGEPEQRTKSVQQATIKAGESLSSAINLTSGALALLIAPPQWTSANISFSVSADSTTWADLFDMDGAEVIKPIGEGTAVNVDTSLTEASLYVRFRSGPRSAPVRQAQDAIFTCVII